QEEMNMKKEAEAETDTAAAEKDTEQTTDTQTQETEQEPVQESKKEKKLFKKDKVAELEKKISELEEEVAKQKNACLKAYADTESLRKRLQSEAETTRKYRIQSFACRLRLALQPLAQILRIGKRLEIRVLLLGYFF